MLVAVPGIGAQTVIEPFARSGVQPAATLLLPYFEVDLGDPTGQTTFFSVNNASAAPALARVVVWSDLAVPVLGFSVYLTGFDVQVVSLRDVMTGVADFTADCQGTPLSADRLAEIQALLRGLPSPDDGLCAGRGFGALNQVARGYVTIDSVNAPRRPPGTPGIS